MFQHVGQDVGHHVAPVQNYRLLWYGPRLNKAEALKESSNDKECGHTKARIFHLTSTHLVMKTERESHKFENYILRYIITCVKGFILNTIIRCLPLSFLHTKQCNLKTQSRDVSLRGFLRGSWTLRKFAKLQSAAVQMSCIAWIRERPSTTRFPIDIPAHWRPTNENWYTMWQ